MARSPSLRLSQAVVDRQREAWGENSAEFQLLNLVATTRVPYAVLSEIVEMSGDNIRRKVTGETKWLEEDSYARQVMHYVLHHGYQLGLLPCSDASVLPGIIRFVYDQLVVKQQPAESIDDKIYDLNQKLEQARNTNAELLVKVDELEKQLEFAVAQEVENIHNTNPTSNEELEELQARLEEKDSMIRSLHDELVLSRQQTEMYKTNSEQWHQWYEANKHLLS